MATRKSIWLLVLAIVSSLLLSSVASAQNDDWPMLKGVASRVGYNGDWLNSGPGLANLVWWAPSSTDNRYTTPLTIDNTNTVQGANSAGYFSLNSGVGATWYGDPLAQALANFDASNPYLVYDANGNPINPAYIYSGCVASSTTSATAALNASALSTASWTFTPPTGAPNLYALYVNIPVGNQQLNSGTGLHGTTGWQRYFVYTIQTSPSGPVYTDVVDTTVSGGGWVRLGGGGAPTNMVFPYDGINNITITLYNTVPRDSNGNLTEPVTGTGASNVYVVYADAAQAVPTNGYYDASPISAQLTQNGVSLGGSSTRTIGALNAFSSGGAASGTFTTIATAAVTSYQTSTGLPVWTYSPVDTGSYPVLTDVSESNSSGTPWLQDSTLPFQGANLAETTPIVANGAVNSSGVISATGQVLYQPTLNTGTYQIYVYLPGNDSTHTYGKGVQYVVEQGLTQTPVFVDQSVPSGWHLLSSSRFSNTTAAPLKLLVTNVSSDSTNNNDVGSLVYADAVRFVGEKNSQVSSTPITATVWLNIPGKGPTLTQVVVVADENGIIHCLDATGNTDGTTTEYWTYPSTLGSGGTDPNAGPDAGSEMPSGFSLSSALIVQPGVTDSTGHPDSYLYIGTANGRVYCIDMEGRGDGATTTNGLGTTTRIWTYPASPGATGSLGSFRGSVAYGAPGNVPTIYVPTTQGRMYALNALGSPTTHSTSVIWAYPALNKPTLGEIWTTPVFQQFKGNSYLYFGTRQNVANTNQTAATDSNGVFYCFQVNNATTAANPRWFWDGSETFTDAITGVATVVPTGDFLSSPTVVPRNMINPNDPTEYPATDGIVYVANQNNYIYAFNAVNGGVATQTFSGTNYSWNPTNELNVGALGGISYTVMSVYTQGGAITPLTPTITVPTLNGQFDALFADPATSNVDGTRLCWGWNTPAPLIGSTMAISNSWMFGTDEAGFIYGFNNAPSGSLSGGTPPGSGTITENNPAGAIFREAKIKLLTPAGYNLLRQPNGQNLTYGQAVTQNTYSFTRTPLAFEWGETAYVLVYNFPYANTSPNGTTVPPPTINITISSQGKTLRTVTAQAREFTTVSPGTDPPYLSDNMTLANGYAVLSYTLGVGAQGLPPGAGMISISVATSSLNNFGAQQTVAQDLASPSSRVPFYMANPLAISMQDPTTQALGEDVYSLGLSVSPANAENLVNGSPVITSGLAEPKNTALLGASAGIANHGTSVTAPIYVYDRSMMALTRPDNSGLSGIRVDLRNLGWEGGHQAITNPLNPTYYVNYEDYPDNYPNNSIDYPDIQTAQVQVVSNPNGAAMNPRFNSVDLVPPLVKDPTSGMLRNMQMGDAPESRVLQPTPFNLTINVPRFQPANTNILLSSLGALVGDSNPAEPTPLSQGYLGRVFAFVDSDGNGLLSTTPAETYRSFNLMTSVDVDEKMTVSTPTVNLGTLPSGTGFNPRRPGEGAGTQGYDPTGANNSNTVFEPWAGAYAGLFQPFVVNNEGNVNLLNVRVAKAYQIAQGNPPTIPSNPLPWSFSASSNDPLGFLDGSVDLWSDIDAVFAPTGAGQQVAFQKPRVTDISPTQLVANTVRRPNANLGTTGTFVPSGGTVPLPDVLNKTLTPAGTLLYPPVSPRVAVSIPLGMPAGAYSQQIRVIEKNSANEIWQMFHNAPETYTDPTVTVNFNVRETQLTTTNTAGASFGFDNLTPPSATNPLSYSSMQPAMVRDQYGSLIVAFASDRKGWTSVPTSNNDLGNYTLYLGTVGNSAAFGNTSGITNTLDSLSPLSDLDSAIPASSTQWFSQAVGTYPSQAPDVLFGSQTGESVITGTLQYGNPSFPTAGLANPFNPGQYFQGMFMAFTGSAQKQTSSGRLGESALFMTTISSSSGGGLATPPQPIGMLSNLLLQKGKPSVLQTSAGALVFYPGVADGVSNVYYSAFNGTTFGPSVPLPFGSGFQSVTDISTSGRVYSGAGEFKTGATTPYLANGTGIAELTFTGLLRGRAFPEVFFGRAKLNPALSELVDDNGNAIDSAASDGNVFLDLPTISNEILVATGQPGQYRSNGIQWDETASITLNQSLNGGAPQSLLVAGTAVYDRATGIISYDSVLGGKVYFDTTMGTVRFSSGSPNTSAQLWLTYTPRFLRVSSGATSGYAKPTGVFDNREISNPTYWRRPNGAFADYTDDIKSARYVFTYNQASSGAGTPSRPYLSTKRLGLQLTYRIAADNNGNPLGVQVSGSKPISAYQIDPANGRIYFTNLDEDNVVSVTYTALAENGTTSTWTDSGIVTLVQETPDQPILIDNAVNESDLTTFLDPFSYVPASQRRPPLMWLFWTSARSGTPNLFFETISPQWSPIPIGQ